MPYTIEHTEGQYCVHKADMDGNATGDSLGCHDTNQEAVDQIAAIEAQEGSGKSYRTQGAIKAVAANRVGGYLVVYGNKNTRDLQGEYFTKDTALGLDLFDTRPALYHHGLDGATKFIKIGTIDKLESDDIGLWAEAQIELHNEYAKAIMKLVDKGILSWSSGSLPHLVDVASDGRIKAWPIVEGSLTPTPAEPRNTDITTLKHISEALELLDGLNAKGAQSSQSGNNNAEQNLPHRQKENLMPAMKNLTEEGRAEVKEMIDAAIAEAMSVVAEEVGEELPPEVQEEIAEVVAEGAVAIIEEEIPEAVANADNAEKAEGDEEDEKDKEEEGAKSVRWVRKNLDRIIDKAIGRYEAGNVTRKNNAKTRGSRLANAAKKQAPAQSAKSRLGGYRESPASQLSVGDEQRFADATWQDMALYVKVKCASELGNLPEYMRKRVKVGDVVSPEFARVLAYKMSAGLKAEPLDDAIDALAIKAQAPWLKADELDATDITNQGLEWVGTTFDADLWQRARHELRLLDLLTSKGMRIKDVDPGTNKVTFAIDTGSGTVYTRGEPNSLDATGRPEATVQVQPFTTDNVTMTAKEHALAYIPSNWLTEDTFVDTMGFINFDMLQTLMESLESTLINGDTETAANTNINLIDGTPATGLQTPDYIAWDGIRKNFRVTNTGQSRDAGGALAITDYINTRALFGTTVRNRKQNMLTIIDFDTEVATRKLVQLLTADVAGGAPLATMYTGDLPQVLDGVDTYTSGLLALANTAGKISATADNNVTGTIINVYAPYIAYGRKRQVEVKQQEDILAGGIVFVASIRHTSIHRSADGSAGTYNVGV